MYISVDNYKEMYLLGKSASAVTEEIEKIRREIAKVKNKLESPANAHDARSYSTENTAIDAYKKYLAAAIKYYSEITEGESALSEEEKASMVFDSQVDDISCVTLTVGRYLQDKYELMLEGDRAELSEIHLGSDVVRKAVNPVSSREVIRALHIGEWKDNYTPDQYGCTLNEPTRWQVRIDYYGVSAPRFFDGVGVFPYNFSLLARLMNADIF